MSDRLKLNLFIGIPAYGGNGGVSSLYPEIARWLAELMIELKGDERIGEVHVDFYSDTPITMVRNAYVEKARKLGCHLLLMVDSDQDPNLHRGQDWYKPFWNVAFDAIYAHYSKGPLVIGAPYCGPPNSGENCYVFQWNSQGNHGDGTEFSLDQYTRAQAAVMSGLQECGALPTGMILFDTRIFELLDANRMSKEDALIGFRDGKLTLQEALRSIQDGYFYYEWKDRTASEKASTEDVAATRDMSLVGRLKLGYNPVMCAWDSWVGHMKPWCVGRPKIFSVEQVGGVLKRAVLDNVSYRDRVIRVRNDDLLKAIEANGR